MSTDRWMDKEDVVHIYNGILLSHKKRMNNAVFSNMDGPRDYHTKWSKSGRERQIPYDITYMWNLKYDTGDFPGGAVVKNLPANARDMGLSPGPGRSHMPEQLTSLRTLEPASHSYWARVPQLLKPTCLEPVLHSKRSHRNEKPPHHNKE